MTEASNSSPSLSLAGDNLDSSSTAVDLFPQYPKSRIGDDADAWMPPFMDFEELPCPWDEYETTKEIYEQAVFITVLARRSELSVYPKWKECIKA